MTTIAAVILAGGKGERLGGINKALLKIGGRSLIERAIAATAACRPVLLSVGHTRFETDLVQVLDLDTDYGGPLAGVAAAAEFLRASPPDLVLTLAVDTPLFPADFLTRALPLLDLAPAAIAAFGAQDYPTNGLWRFASLADLPAALRAGTAPHSLKRLAASCGTAHLDYALSGSDDPFLNINTPEDLAYFQARLTGAQPG